MLKKRNEPKQRKTTKYELELMKATPELYAASVGHFCFDLCMIGEGFHGQRIKYQFNIKILKLIFLSCLFLLFVYVGF